MLFLVLFASLAVGLYTAAATNAIVDETVASVLEVRAEGNGRLAQLVDLMYLGDWVSLYLALDAGVDPGPIDAIARLKDELAR